MLFCTRSIADEAVSESDCSFPALDYHRRLFLLFVLPRRLANASTSYQAQRRDRLAAERASTLAQDLRATSSFLFFSSLCSFLSPLSAFIQQGKHGFFTSAPSGESDCQPFLPSQASLTTNEPRVLLPQGNTFLLGRTLLSMKEQVLILSLRRRSGLTLSAFSDGNGKERERAERGQILLAEEKSHLVACRLFFSATTLRRGTSIRGLWPSLRPPPSP